MIQSGADFERETLALVKPPFKSRFGAVKWGDLDAHGPEHEWLISELVTRGEVSMIAGPSGSGKSFLAIEAAMCIARGVPFLGRDVIRGGVIYQAGESPLGVRRKRLRVYRQQHGLSLDQDIPFILLQAPIDLYSSDEDANAMIAEVEALRGGLSAPLEVLFVDTFSAAIPGADENSAKDVTPVLKRCARIAAACKIAVILIHHMRAEGDKVRGSTAIQANVDSVLACAKTEKHAEDGLVIRELRVRKMKDEADDGPALQFTLPFFEIGKDRNGRPVRSCIVRRYQHGDAVPAVAAPERKGFAANQTEMEFLQALRDAMASHGTVPPPGSELPPAVERVVEVEHVRSLYMARLAVTEQGEPERVEGRLRTRWSRATKSLIQFGVIGSIKPYVWFRRTDIRNLWPERRPAAPPVDTGEPANDDISDMI